MSVRIGWNYDPELEPGTKPGLPVFPLDQTCSGPCASRNLPDLHELQGS